MITSFTKTQTPRTSGNMSVHRAGTELRLRRENLKRDLKAFTKFHWIVESRAALLVLDMITLMHLMKGIHRGLGLKMLALETEGTDSLSHRDLYPQVIAHK